MSRLSRVYTMQFSRPQCHRASMVSRDLCVNVCACNHCPFLVAVFVRTIITLERTRKWSIQLLPCMSVITRLVIVRHSHALYRVNNIIRPSPPAFNWQAITRTVNNDVIACVITIEPQPFLGTPLRCVLALARETVAEAGRKSGTRQM